MDVEILMQIHNVDFGIIGSFKDDMVRMDNVHGDVLVVKGMVEDDPEEIMTLGVVEGENVARIAFYKHMDEIKAMLQDGSQTDE